MKNLKWLNAGAFVLMIAVNLLANTLPIGGNTTGQVSENYANLFTPAPVTFAIWALIYIMMLVFVIYQFGILDGGRYSTKVREDIGLRFVISCILNTVWIFLWHYRLIGLSSICIAALLIVLLMIPAHLTNAGGRFLQRTAAKAGFSLYYGWIIAATIANVCVYLVQIGWDGWGISQDFWTVTVLLIGAVVAAAVVLIGEDPIAAGAVMWAYAGILIRHLSPVYYGGTHPFVIVAGFISETAILAAIVLHLIRKTYRKRMSVC